LPLSAFQLANLIVTTPFHGLLRQNVRLLILGVGELACLVWGNLFPRYAVTSGGGAASPIRWDSNLDQDPPRVRCRR
jgi:hypothetical protein